MSAWIVSKRHIDALVTPLYKTIDMANKIGQLLWEQNHRSVNHRYNKQTQTPKYEYEPCTDYVKEQDQHILTLPLEVLDLLKLLDSYEYQSCEVKFDAEVSIYCQRLRKHLVSQLDGYKDSVWAI
jgi:hypothetical protein